VRLRVLVGEKVVSDLKIQKDQLAAFSDAIARLGGDPDQWLEPMSLSFGDLRVDGMLKSIERTKENGEEVVALQFWENA
jgi:hypothetical protein